MKYTQSNLLSVHACTHLTSSDEVAMVTLPCLIPRSPDQFLAPMWSLLTSRTMVNNVRSVYYKRTKLLLTVYLFIVGKDERVAAPSSVTIAAQLRGPRRSTSLAINLQVTPCYGHVNSSLCIHFFSLFPDCRIGFSSLASAFSRTLDVWTSGSATQRYGDLL